MSARGRPFEMGNTSGQGRPRGSPNKKSLVLQQLLLDQGGEIIQTLINRAKKGDRTALALCVERLIPRLKVIVPGEKRGGLVMVTFTPLHGWSEVVERFLGGSETQEPQP